MIIPQPPPGRRERPEGWPAAVTIAWGAAAVLFLLGAMFLFLR